MREDVSYIQCHCSPKTHIRKYDFSLHLIVISLILTEYMPLIYVIFETTVIRESILISVERKRNLMNNILIGDEILRKYLPVSNEFIVVTRGTIIPYSYLQFIYLLKNSTLKGVRVIFGVAWFEQEPSIFCRELSSKDTSFCIVRDGDDLEVSIFLCENVDKNYVEDDNFNLLVKSEGARVIKTTFDNILHTLMEQKCSDVVLIDVPELVSFFRKTEENTKVYLSSNSFSVHFTNKEPYTETQLIADMILLRKSGFILLEGLDEKGEYITREGSYPVLKRIPYYSCFVIDKTVYIHHKEIETHKTCSYDRYLEVHSFPIPKTKDEKLLRALVGYLKTPIPSYPYLLKQDEVLSVEGSNFRTYAIGGASRKYLVSEEELPPGKVTLTNEISYRSRLVLSCESPLFYAYSLRLSCFAR